MPPPSHPPTPLLLLKAPSPSPSQDTYTTTLPSSLTPHYIPPLTHTLHPDPLIKLFLAHFLPSPSTPPFPYGALIFTSQRATSALHAALASPPLQSHLPALRALSLRLYTVGPATASAARELCQKFLPGCDVLGGASVGDGGKLGRYILDEEGEGEYDQWEGAWMSINDESSSSSSATIDNVNVNTRIADQQQQPKNKKIKKPVLFLTGEKRRDILPRLLASPPTTPDEAASAGTTVDALVAQRRIQVEEMVVYTSAVLEEFAHTLQQALRRTEGAERRVVVLFSPAPARILLETLGWLDVGGKGRLEGGMMAGGEGGRRTTFLGCIGPTTAGWLREEFGVEADVVAGVPSAVGLGEGLERFLREEEGGRGGGVG